MHPICIETYEELLTVQDDRNLSDMALAAILDFAATQGKRLLLLVENLNSLFNEIGAPEVGWELRKTLQCEPRIFLLGSATSRFAEIDNAKRALYDLFQVHTLKGLDTEACATLWRSVSETDIDPRAIRSLEILTGGNPRLLSIVAEFGSRLSFRELMDDLLDLVDDHTEYFRSHLEALGAQERRVYLALAALWKPSTANQVSVIARLSASHCSAVLKRLVDRGEVIRSGGIARRREYYLAERMYNIYYLLRRGRGTNQVVEALVRFMTAFYSEPETGRHLPADHGGGVGCRRGDGGHAGESAGPAARRDEPRGGSRRTAGSFRSTSRELVRESQEAARAGSRFPRIEGRRVGRKGKGPARQPGVRTSDCHLRRD